MANPVLWKPTTNETTYEIRSLTWQCDDAGRRFNHAENRGTFTRRPGTLDGKPADEFEWLGFEVSDPVPLDEEITVFRTVPDAKGFTYTIDFEAQFEKLPVDTSPIERTPDSWHLYLSTLDAHMQFDLVRTKRYGDADKLSKPGVRIERTSPERAIETWDTIAIVMEDSQAKAWTDWIGDAEFDGEPSHNLYYRVENVFFDANIKMGDSDLNMRASTRYSGLIHISASDGSLLGGDLYEFGGGGGGAMNREVYLRRLR